MQKYPYKIFNQFANTLEEYIDKDERTLQGENISIKIFLKNLLVPVFSLYYYKSLPGWHDFLVSKWIKSGPNNHLQ